MYLYLFPVVAALMGWLANLLFVRYLFRKLIPAQAQVLAAAAGRYASSELLNADKLAARLTDPERLRALTPLIESHIDIFLKEKLKEKMPAIAMFIGDKTIEMMKKSLMDEIDLLLPNLLGRYMGSLGEQLDIEKALVKKLEALPEGKIEALLNQHLGREKRRFQLLGALTGLLTGLVLMGIALMGAR
ncbi:hypothetical protein [Taibaiella koreensis]|uniref:hypothetical protein n=1 Tax=Taibaiella koreensis TaxID=1268548 RepID=UPI000E59AC78|nr:hypothetical protein [Taibaiella koreensis]